MFLDFLRLLMRFFSRIFFNFRMYNADILSSKGPIILTPNHVSWLDAALLFSFLDKDWKFVVSKGVTERNKFLSFLTKNDRTIPVDPGSPFSFKDVIKMLKRGDKIVIFPEGSMSRSGRLRKLYEGTGFLVHLSDAKIIHCYLQGAEISFLGRHKGWKRWFPVINAYFSEILTPPKFEEGTKSIYIREKITNWLRDEMLSRQYKIEHKTSSKNLLQAIAKTAKYQANKRILQEVNLTTMQMPSLTYKKLMISSYIIANKFEKLLFNDTSLDKRVAVLLPNVMALPVSLLALWKKNRVAAILNFSNTPQIMFNCISLAKTKSLITSKVFLEKGKIDISLFSKNGINIIYLEDLKTTINIFDKMVGFISYIFCKIPKIEKKYEDGSNTAVILYTSGSEGSPKGVELTHNNITANVRQAFYLTDLQDHDRVFNAMPLFHSFGLTVGTMLPLMNSLYTFLYPSPLHYRIIPSFVYDRDCTILMGTNTFLNAYAKRAHQYDFHSVRRIWAGAEKIQDQTFDLWAKKFGIRIFEGYGATECAPAISLNNAVECRISSVGRVLPGIEYKIEKVEGIEEGGRLLVKGENVMKGYLNVEANEQFKKLQGWYDTGDIVKIDADGYVYIMGRLKRFAKISGEMVSLSAVEDAIITLKQKFSDNFDVAIIAIPDIDKGEILIAIVNDDRVIISDVRQSITQNSLSNLAFPKYLYYMQEIPKLGSGKYNYQQILSIYKEQNIDIIKKL